MSAIAIGMNLLLAGLLAAALVLGIRLNNRLKALRDSHDGFAKAVADLDVAAARAEQGLADLRAATDEAADLLADRIEKARALTAKLDRQTQGQTHGAPPVSSAPPTAGQPAPRPAESASRPLQLGPRPAPQPERLEKLGALLASARQPRQRPDPGRGRFGSAPAPERPRLRFEDDLFDDEPPLTLRNPRGRS